MKVKVKVTQLCLTLCDPTDYNRPWNFPGQNTGMGSLTLLQGIFPTQESNWGLLHCRQILHQLSYQGILVLYSRTLLSILSIKACICQTHPPTPSIPQPPPLWHPEVCSLCHDSVSVSLIDPFVSDFRFSMCVYNMVFVFLILPYFTSLW